jgi:hypothetical protein
MKGSFNCIAGLLSLAIAPLMLETSPVLAQPNGLNGSYLGVTVDTNDAFGLSQDYLQQANSPAKWFIDQALEGSQFTSGTTNTSLTNGLDGRGFQGRIDLNNSPISIRGKVSLGSEANVVQPIVSYDLAIARNANIYAGAGYSFINSKDKAISSQDQNAFFVTAGAEAAINDKVVVYGDAQYPVNPSDLKVTSPVKVQVGVGFRF